MTVVYGAALAMVSVAGLLTVARLVRGPAALDRIIALDVLVGMVILGVFLFQIREQFDSLDIHHLEKLKDE